ncbi:MAG: hypothetical protein M0Z95_21260 [Actinomycetota bacterium]|nr:hypothetical protein [Actinomycetota bacterium]
MTLPDHVEGEMRELPLGKHGVDEFLDGKVGADDAPPGFQDVARLLHAARSPATAGELAGQDHVVATLAATVRGSAGVSGSVHERRRTMLTKLLTAKMAAAAAAAVILGGGAAAATGTLPTSLQSSVSHGLSTVGISVPNPDAHAAGNVATTSSRTTGPQGRGAVRAKPSTPPTQAAGPSATGPALYGLCTAYATAGVSQAARHSVAFRNLSAAATAKGETVAQYCAKVTPPSTVPTTTTTGASHAPTSGGPPSGSVTARSGGQRSAHANSHAPVTPGSPPGTPGSRPASSGTAS